LKSQETVDRVRNTLVKEIVGFHVIAEDLGASNAEGFEDDAGHAKFSVTNPIKMSDTAGLKIGSVIKYTVSGIDSQGRFEIQRRYNEFMMLK